MKRPQPNDIHDLSAEALTCREFRHAWTWKSDLGIRTERGRVVGWDRILVCERGCGTIRRESIAADGSKSFATYEYAEGYQLHGIGPITAADVRLEWVRRAVAGELPGQ